MSDRLQFEYHPDADQISAFVEQALPAHEREQMLDHLAVCPECRAVVALSLPAVEAPAKSLPAPARKPWWSGWMVAWPAAAALAAVVLFVVYLHHAAIVPNAPAPAQIASANLPVASTTQGQPPAPSAAAVPRGSQTQPAGSSGESSASGAGVAAKQNHAIGVPAQSVAGLAIEGRNVGPPVAMAQASSAPSPGSTGQDAVTGTRAAAGVAAGTYESVKAPSAVADARLQKPAPVAPPAIASAQPVTSAAAMALPASNSETVAVTSAAVMPTVSPEVGNIAIAENEIQGTLLRHSLPSRLPVLSMATQERRIVAIDTRNEVFLSKDGGKHWKAIRATWPGRAVKADLVVYPAGGSFALGRDEAALKAVRPADNNAPAGNSSGALAVQNRALRELPGSSLTGRVTDATGAVIAGASISVTDSTAHAVRTARTDGAGRYVVDGLAPGAYRVEAQARGFETKVVAAVAVTASRPTVQDLTLNVGAATQTVTVEASSMEIPVSETKKARPTQACQTPRVFQIITDNGERWTSTDGVTWKPM